MLTHSSQHDEEAKQVFSYGKYWKYEKYFLSLPQKSINYHSMKRKTRLFDVLGWLWLLLLIPMQSQGQSYLTSISQLETGYYRVYSLAYDATMVMSETEVPTLVVGNFIYPNVFCDTPNENDYMQVWKIVVSASTETTKTVQFQNVMSERWINRSSGNFHTYPTAQTYTMEMTASGFIIYYGGGFHHQQNGHDVTSYGTDAAASKWQLEKVTIDADALATQKESYTAFSNLVNNKGTITTALAKYFTDGSCSALKDAYQSYSDDELTTAMKADNIPQAAIDMALKVKNHTWATYQEGWRYNEKTFRIGTYKPISKESRWRSIVNVGYALSPNSDPTGIYVEAGDIITVYVGSIPSGGSILLRNVPHQGASGDSYELTAGFNILKIQSEGCLFVDYEVDNTTNGGAPYTALSSYADVAIHIEGGEVNGAFSAPRGDTNGDWAIMKEKLFKHYDYLQLRSRTKIFNMRADYVMSACPTNMVGLLGQWDFVVEMEHNIMGLDAEFDGYFNTPMMAVSFDGSGHMYASTYGTYYNENTLSDVMNYDNLFAGGSLWGPAHEIGHINQATINIIGQSEVSNNLFSNIAVFLNGHLTSRAEYISTTFQNMADGVYWQDRGIWERTHMYFQLYQFFHAQGYKSDFYQEFFKALRTDPCTRIQNTFIDATDDYLKFYKKACQVSGYDLTEFFQAYGFFVVPTLTSYTVKNQTKDAFWVGDYGNYYLIVTQEMIDAAIAEVKTMNLPKANIVFIEDRISAPDATYEGVSAGTKKTAFSGYPFGRGDVGQYTDFIKTTAATGYKASYAEDNEGNLVVMVDHTDASGAVGFKVYDASHHLLYLSNTYSFSVPAAIYSQIKNTAFEILAAAPDGNDYNMEAAENYVEWIVKDEAGNVLKRHTQLTIVGQEITAYPEEIVAPFVTLPDLVSFTYTASMDKEKEVVATISTPFKSSTATTGYYYYVKVRNGYLCQNDAAATLTTTKGSEDTYRWAFYGNPYDGYRLKNKVTGLWLCAGNSTNNGELPVLRNNNPTYWTIDYFNSNKENAPQFQMSVPGTTHYLNDYGGNGTKIAFYGSGSFILVSDEEEVSMPTVTINVTSHLSSFSYPASLVVPDDVNIFIITSTDLDKKTLKVDGLDTKIVPANTGVLLYSDEGGEKVLSLGAWVDTSVSELYEGNLLQNTASEGFTVGAENIYALRAGQTAFAHVATGVTMPAKKAYLSLSSNESRIFTLDFGGKVTRINDVSILPSDEHRMVNLNGQHVSRHYQGIVVYHGKKILQR